jgi:hypothetical protein
MTMTDTSQESQDKFNEIEKRKNHDSLLAKYKPYLEGLHSSSLEERYQCIRRIKNTIIGNKTKKDVFAELGIIPKYI